MGRERGRDAQRAALERGRGGIGAVAAAVRTNPISVGAFARKGLFAVQRPVDGAGETPASAAISLMVTRCSMILLLCGTVPTMRR